jgi:hypothetical protein
MDVSFIDITNNFSIAIVDNFYSVSELKEIKDELKLLSAVAELKVFVNKPAKDEENNSKQKSNSFFLDTLYNNKRDLSKILTLNRKLFSNELNEKLVEKNLFYRQVQDVNSDSTLLNFYKSTDYYKPHNDTTCFTALTFFTLEEFYGGDLVFPEYNLKVGAVENRMVIFPGFVLHGSEEVKSGIRVSMAQFLNYRMVDW